MIPRYEVIKAIADISGQSVDSLVNIKQFDDDSDEWPTEEEVSESDTPREPEVATEMKLDEESESGEQAAHESDEEEETPESETSQSNFDNRFEKDDNFEWHTDDSFDDPLGIIKGSENSADDDLAGERKKDHNRASSRSADAKVDLNSVNKVSSFVCIAKGVGYLQGHGIQRYCILMTQSDAAAADAGSPEEVLEEIDPNDLLDAATAAKEDEVRAHAILMKCGLSKIGPREPDKESQPQRT